MTELPDHNSKQINDCRLDLSRKITPDLKRFDQVGFDQRFNWIQCWGLKVLNAACIALWES